MENTTQKPGVQLSYLMKQLKHNNTTLADLVQVHRNTVANWRRGVTPIPPAVMLLLQERLEKEQRMAEFTKRAVQRVAGDVAEEFGQSINARIVESVQSAVEELLEDQPKPSA